jgi:hypothetical protein
MTVETSLGVAIGILAGCQVLLFALWGLLRWDMNEMWRVHRTEIEALRREVDVWKALQNEYNHDR